MIYGAEGPKERAIRGWHTRSESGPLWRPTASGQGHCYPGDALEKKEPNVRPGLDAYGSLGSPKGA